jgi:hypothetical protein
MMYVRLEPPPDESTRLTCAPLLLPKLYAFCSPDQRPYGSIRRAKRQPTIASHRNRFARYIASAASASQTATTAKGRHPVYRSGFCRSPARLLPALGEDGDRVGDQVLNLVRHPALPANVSATMPLTPSGSRTRNLM